MTNTQIAPLVSPRQQGGGLFPSSEVRQTNKGLQALDGRGQVARGTELIRGRLTNDVLEMAGALSAFESQLIQVAPLGEARYKAIVDAWAMGAMNAVMRFQ